MYATTNRSDIPIGQVSELLSGTHSIRCVVADNPTKLLSTIFNEALDFSQHVDTQLFPFRSAFFVNDVVQIRLAINDQVECKKMAGTLADTNPTSIEGDGDGLA